MTSQLCGRPRARRRPAQCTRAASIEGCGRRSATSRTSPSRAFSSRHHARGPHDAAQGCRGFADVIDQLPNATTMRWRGAALRSGCGRAAMEPSQYSGTGARGACLSDLHTSRPSRPSQVRERLWTACGVEPARFPKSHHREGRLPALCRQDGAGQLRGQLEPNGDTIRFAFSIASA